MLETVQECWKEKFIGIHKIIFAKSFRGINVEGKHKKSVKTRKAAEVLLSVTKYILIFI